MQINNSLLTAAFKVLGIWLMSWIVFYSASLFGILSVSYIAIGVICFVLSTWIINLRKKQTQEIYQVDENIQKSDEELEGIKEIPF